MNTNEIKARAEAATPAPWEWNKSRFYGGYSGITGKDNMEVLFPNHCNDGDDGAAWFEDFPNDADRDFIAHAREDIPDLLAEIDRLQKELDAAVGDIPHDCQHCAYSNPDGSCTCLPDGDAFSPDYTEGFDRDNCEHWEWRGRESEGK